MLHNFLNHREIKKETGLHICLSFFGFIFSNIFEALGIVCDFSFMSNLLFYVKGLFPQV